MLTKNVAEVRKVYPRQELDYLCTNCKQERVDAMIDRERKRLGLPPRQDP